MRSCLIASPLVSEFLSLRTALELAYSGLLQQSHVFACCSALGQLARAITLANDQSFSAWRSPPPFGGIGNPDGPGSPTFRGVGTLTWSQRIQVIDFALLIDFEILLESRFLHAFWHRCCFNEKDLPSSSDILNLFWQTKFVSGVVKEVVWTPLISTLCASPSNLCRNDRCGEQGKKLQSPVMWKYHLLGHPTTMLSTRLSCVHWRQETASTGSRY